MEEALDLSSDRLLNNNSLIHGRAQGFGAVLLWRNRWVIEAIDRLGSYAALTGSWLSPFRDGISDL